MSETPIIRASAVLIYRYDKGSKEVILVKHGRKSRHDYGKWGIPGGIIEYGESPEETAIREVKEETGLDIKSLYYLDTRPAYLYGGLVKGIIDVYESECFSGEIKRPENNESIEEYLEREEELPEFIDIRDAYKYEMTADEEFVNFLLACMRSKL